MASLEKISFDNSSDKRRLFEGGERVFGNHSLGDLCELIKATPYLRSLKLECFDGVDESKFKLFCEVSTFAIFRMRVVCFFRIDGRGIHITGNFKELKTYRTNLGA